MSPVSKDIEESSSLKLQKKLVFKKITFLFLQIRRMICIVILISRILNLIWHQFIEHLEPDPVLSAYYLISHFFI